MKSKFNDIELLPFHQGKSKGDYFQLPIKLFGRDCTQLYKIRGFLNNNGAWWVYASRIDKKTHRIANNAPIFEGFKFVTIFK